MSGRRRHRRLRPSDAGHLEPEIAGAGPAALPARVPQMLAFLFLTAMITPAVAKAPDCGAYARSYADARTSPTPESLSVADGAMGGAIAGGAWEGPSGARRGAIAGGALSVLDSLGNYPAGWRALYDLAYRLCRNAQSPVTHRPNTLGDPAYRPSPSPAGQAIPPLPAPPDAPVRHDR